MRIDIDLSLERLGAILLCSASSNEHTITHSKHLANVRCFVMRWACMKVFIESNGRCAADKNSRRRVCTAVLRQRTTEVHHRFSLWWVGPDADERVWNYLTKTGTEIEGRVSDSFMHLPSFETHLWFLFSVTTKSRHDRFRRVLLQCPRCCFRIFDHSYRVPAHETASCSWHSMRWQALRAGVSETEQLSPV